MELDGNIIVFIRLEGESPVTVFKEDESQVSNVRVLPVSSSSNLQEVVAEHLGEHDVLDGIVAFNEDVNALASDLGVLTPHIKAGGTLHLYVADVDDESKNSVLMGLMIAGFVEAEADAEISGYPGLPTARRFTSKKPAFESGSSAAIPLNSNGTKTAQPLKKWKVVSDDFDGEDDDDVIDEDTLLDDTDEVLQAAKDDCEVGKDGKRRACKNCTCGRKDEEDKPVVSDAELTQMVSSCGNCFKGDAFRCGSCPFLGKPAFKPGMEKVMLNLDDADDI
ncbi:hypothetical protein Poli38472_009904 [Pythium oligandrum]|uniref:Anamorsin homolog n=1 Tax=Pythium oligandrum TaxID=41045 RepID=A0A8K1C8D4_PYTOL|nr:hypothetical protein Poli38472_009904 [Pythium oligandrum]|eukprot:TMW58345.1 hypothetical protein Poli38472_009904 [Pythium oligandrum]